MKLADKAMVVVIVAVAASAAVCAMLLLRVRSLLERSSRVDGDELAG